MKYRVKLTAVTAVCVAMGVAATRCSLSPGDAAQGEGSLRILVTDKPFPLDLIEEATITVTRVDVRRADEQAACTLDADCADDIHCNGTETCIDGTCTNGTFPCEAGKFCDEETRTCLSPCMDDTQCNDAVFCNGIETCNLTTGECEEGENPCLQEQVCMETVQTCVDDSDSSDDEDDGSAWITVFEGEQTFNLLDLQNGQTDLLAESIIPAGSYTQTRLVVTQGSVKLFGIEQPFALNVPSGERTGIKLHFTFTIASDEETVLLLDVDLSRAFRPIPGGQIEDPSSIRTFHFTPSVAMKLIDLVDAGSISGVVTDDLGTTLAGVLVTAYHSDGAEATSTGTDADGAFTIIGLITDTYRLEFVLAGFEDAERTNVSVTAGSTNDVGMVALTPSTP